MNSIGMVQDLDLECMYILLTIKLALKDVRYIFQMSLLDLGA